MANELINPQATGGGNGPDDLNSHSNKTHTDLPTEVIAKLEQPPLHFTTLPLSEALLSVSQLPTATMPDGTPKPDKVWTRELPQWMLGGKVELAANLAISLITTELGTQLQSESQETDRTTQLLGQLATAEARLAWEQRLNEKRREHPDPDEFLSTQRTFLTNYVERRRQELTALWQTGWLPTLLPEITRVSLQEMINAARHSDVVFGRADRGFFDAIYIKGLWEQLALREEPRFDRDAGMPFIGFVLLATRNNPENGELELAVSIDKEPGTVSVRPTHQVSATRLPRFDGIRWTPREDEDEPWLRSVQDFLTDRKLTSGVEVFSINSNPSRMVRADPQGVFASPAVLTVRLDLDRVPGSVRASAQEIIKGKHWLTLRQIEDLLVISNSSSAPFVNEFMAGAIGMVLLREYQTLNAQYQKKQALIHDTAARARATEDGITKLLEDESLAVPELTRLIGQLVASIASLANSQNLPDNDLGESAPIRPLHP